MADYFAVLNRTLSGFSDPKPALREKLYERARVTIARQLDLRRPTIDDQFIAGELAKLEEAITRIESGFVGEAVSVPEPAQPAQSEPEVQPVPPAVEPGGDSSDRGGERDHDGRGERADSAVADEPVGPAQPEPASVVPDRPDGPDGVAVEASQDVSVQAGIHLDGPSSASGGSIVSDQPSEPDVAGHSGAVPQPVEPAPVSEPIIEQAVQVEGGDSDSLQDEAETPAEADVPVFDRAEEAGSLREILTDAEGDDSALDAVAEELAPAEATMFEPQMPMDNPPQASDTAAAPLTNESDFETSAVLADASSGSQEDVLNAPGPPDPAADDAETVQAWADEFLAMQNGAPATNAPATDAPATDVPETDHSAATPDLVAIPERDKKTGTAGEDADAIMNRLSATVDSLIASSNPDLEGNSGVSQPTDSTVEPVVLDGVRPAGDGVPLPPVERDTPLTIPPAPAYTPRRMAEGGKNGKSGRAKWVGLGLLAILVLLALLLFVPQASSMREGLVRNLGLQDALGPYFTDPAVRPKPVKTIPITPPDDEPSDEATPETVVPFEKREERLTEEGTEIAPEPVEPEPDMPEPAAQLATTPQGQADMPQTGEPADSGLEQGSSSPALPDGPSALLYEEATASGENSVEAGVVRWSLGEESIDGRAPEPVISGRMEVPGRDLVLLLTIKRNLDPALSASHLIELIFAVPDGFSGGAISEMNRFVMKESEQSRGDNLVGVPVKLADGLFMLALNNLDQAKETNFNLLTTRGWIDIPLQYRNGRRALVTLEKGAEGTRVFSEAFDAWSKL